MKYDLENMNTPESKYEIFEMYITKGYFSTRQHIMKTLDKELTRQEKLAYVKKLLEKVFADEEMLGEHFNNNETLLNAEIKQYPQLEEDKRKGVFEAQLIAKYPKFGEDRNPNEISEYRAKINAMIIYMLREWIPWMLNKNPQTDDKGERVHTKDDVWEGTGSKPIPKKLMLPATSKTINKILRNFVDYDNRRLSYKTVFVTKTKTIDGNTKFKSNLKLDESTITEYREFIGRLEYEYKDIMQPILDLLSVHNETTSSKIIYFPPTLIGQLDTRNMKNRGKIYDFWKEVHGEYDDFRDAYSSFITEIEKIEIKSSDKVGGNLYEIVEKLKEFSDEIADGNIEHNFNYIMKFEPMQLPSHIKSEKHIVLFHDLLLNKKMLPLIKPDKIKDEETKTVVSEYDKKGDMTGISAEEEPKNRRGYTELNEEQVTLLGRKLTKLENIKVDPIYYLEFRDKAFRQPTPVVLGELTKLKNLLLNESAKYEVIMDVDIDELVLEYVEDLLDTAMDLAKGEYYLPLSDTTIGGLELFGEGNTISSQQMRKKIQNIVEFLNTFSKIYDGNIFGSSAPSKGRIESMGSSGASNKDVIKPHLESLGSVSEENYIKELTEIQPELNELLKQINSYFITPMESRFIPFNDTFPMHVSANTTQLFRLLASYDDESESVFNHYQGDMSKEGYTKISANSIREITEILNEIITPTITNVMDIKRLMLRGITIVKQVLDLDKFETFAIDEIHEEFGEFFYTILTNNKRLNEWKELNKKTSNPDGLFPSKNSGKKLEDWHNLYKKSRKIYPFNKIIDDIYRNRQTYTGIEAIGATRGETRGSTIISDFLKAKEKYENKPNKSLEKSMMLKAHDEVRHMLNKPVYYNTSSLDDYDHTNVAIDIMKTKYNVDVTAHEIHLIVHEVNSLSEIGIKHGIPKESVYFLKANFR